MCLFRHTTIAGFVTVLLVSSCGGSLRESSPAAGGGVPTAANGGPGLAANGVSAPNSVSADTVAPQAGPAPSVARHNAALDQPTSVGRYDVIELSFPYASGALANPWQDVSVTAALRTPGGRLILIEGFYYDSDNYRVRFAPTELGEYQYTVDVRGPYGNDSYEGRFSSVASSNKGFLRKLASNPYRLVFDDGSIANAVGINDCFAKSGELKGFVEEGHEVDLESYMRAFGAEGAGFNVFRWNPGNCSFDIYGTLRASGNTYLVRESKWADRLLASARAHGFHVMFAFFWKPPDPQLEEEYKQAVRYTMARYGAYVDVWEITNETEEAKFPFNFIQVFSAYVRSLDPYKRMVTNSFPRSGDFHVLDARSPHVQISQDAYLDMKAVTTDFTTGAPVIAGEVYNPGNRNWDQYSAQRMRMYSWTSFFSGLVDVYWATTYKRTYEGVPGNMYLGAEERGYIATLQKLTANVPPSSEFSVLKLTGLATGYALRSSTTLLAYLYWPFGQKEKLTTSFTVDVPSDGTASWINPATGDVVQHVAVHDGVRKLVTPPFVQDLVLSVE